MTEIDPVLGSTPPPPDYAEYQKGSPKEDHIEWYKHLGKMVGEVEAVHAEEPAEDSPLLVADDCDEYSEENVFCQRTSSDYEELKVQGKLAAPLVLTYLIMMMTFIIDVGFLGHLGEDALAASGMANIWILAWGIITSSLASAITPLASQAIGLERPKLASLWFQRGLLVCAIFGIPVMAMYPFAGHFVRWLGAPPHIESLARQYGMLLMPCMPPQLISFSIWDYLMVVDQDTTIQLVGALVMVGGNIPLNYILIYSCELGFEGSPIATTITSWLGLLASLLYCWAKEGALHRMMQGWDLKEAIRYDGLMAYMAVALPSIAAMILEQVSNVTLTVIASQIGPTEINVAACTVVGTAYAIPMNIFCAMSVACSNRVGLAVGLCDAEFATRCSRCGLILILFACIPSLLLFVFGHHLMAVWFTDTAAVEHLAEKVFPYVGFALIFESIFLLCCVGILMGQGNTKKIVAIKLLFIALVVPLGFALGDMNNLKLTGVVIGWCLSTCATATVAIGVVFLTDWDHVFKQAEIRNAESLGLLERPEEETEEATEEVKEIAKGDTSPQSIGALVQ